MLCFVKPVVSVQRNGRYERNERKRRNGQNARIEAVFILALRLLLVLHWMVRSQIPLCAYFCVKRAPLYYRAYSLHVNKYVVCCGSSCV